MRLGPVAEQAGTVLGAKACHLGSGQSWSERRGKNTSTEVHEYCDAFALEIVPKLIEG
jgi:hypothetical protein